MLLDRFTVRSSNQTSGHEIDGPDWYAFYTRHQHEKNLARSLGGKGFEVFLSLYTAVHSLERSGTRNCLCHCFLVISSCGIDRSPGPRSSQPQKY